MDKKIIIVGAGIVGVTLAWYLTHYSKANVILLDQSIAGHGATKSSFAWLNVSYNRPDFYQNLRLKALDEWHALDNKTQGKLNISWNGALSWHDTHEKTASFIESHAEQQFPVEPLTTKEISDKEPKLLNPPDIAAFAKEEGSVDQLWVIKILLEEACENGLTYLPNTNVLQLLKDGQKITGVLTEQDKLYADQVILAAGVNNTELLKQLDINLPLSPSPCILLHLNHPNAQEFIHRIVSTPEMEVRAFHDHKIRVAEDYIDGTAENSPEVIAHSALKTIQSNFAWSEQLTLDSYSVGIRPMPKDEMPIIGKVGKYSGLYLMAMHAGIVLSPIISRLAMNEIIHDQIELDLEPYRLSRFDD